MNRKPVAERRLTLAFDTCGGVELQHGRNVAHAFTPHFHAEYQILVMLGGDLRLLLGVDEYAVAPGQICVVNPRDVHGGRSEGWGWECRNFYVPPDFIRAAIGSAPRFPYPVIDDPPVARALVKAHRLGLSAPSALAADAAIVEALAALFKAHAGADVRAAPAVSAGVAAAVAHLREHFAEAVRVETLARIAGLSLYHFLRVFSRETGLTPHAFQNQLRLAYAKKQLAQGAPAARAAAEAGYYDQSHLIRALRRSHGLTPAMITRAAERNFIQ